jgi:hypothetical protein
MGGDEIALAPFGYRPPFCDQEIRLPRAQIEHVSNVAPLEIDVVDSFRVLAREPDFHTRLD